MTRIRTVNDTPRGTLRKVLTPRVYFRREADGSWRSNLSSVEVKFEVVRY